MAESATPEPTPVQQRLTSLDAYRGFIMVALASEGLGLSDVAEHFPDSRVWQFLGYQFSHVEWLGCGFWDLIQPSFMFMVGVAMAYSNAARAARGQSYARMLGHAVWRSIVLILLGVFLRSDGRSITNWTFMDVVSQIGLGYTFLFLLWNRGWKIQLAAALVILAGYWAFFAQYPPPNPDFDYASVGVAGDWPHLQGFAAHWDKNTNPAAAFDRWFLNLFPREQPFRYEGSGYPTLNFIPSLATMIFGLLAGEWLRSSYRGGAKFALLVGWGLVSLAGGYALDAAGLCPIVKIIWTPSWTLFSTGWTLLLLAAFYGVIDLGGWRRWAFPFVVVGMNSIAIYVMQWLLADWIVASLRTHFGAGLFEVFGKTYEPIVQSVLVLGVLWLICYWMYRRRLFLRI